MGIEISSHLKQCLDLRKQIFTSTGKDMGNEEPFISDCGSENWCNHFKKK